MIETLIYGGYWESQRIHSQRNVLSKALRLVGRETGADPLQAHVDRLVAVNARLQVDFAEGLSAIESVIDERNVLQALIDRAPDMLFVKDLHSRFLVANIATAVGKTFFMSGEAATAATLIGMTDFDLFPRDVAQGFRDVEVEIMRSGEPRADMYEFNVDGTGHSRWKSMTKAPVRNANGEVIGLVGVGRDVTAHKLAEDRVHFMAHHDTLTGLPNRALLADRLGQTILQAKRKHGQATVVFIDLDNFKLINDSLGHEAGDELLKVVAERMRACGANDTVARLGGDEFVILLGDRPKPVRGADAHPGEDPGRCHDR